MKKVLLVFGVVALMSLGTSCSKASKCKCTAKVDGVEYEIGSYEIDEMSFKKQLKARLDEIDGTKKKLETERLKFDKLMMETCDTLQEYADMQENVKSIGKQMEALDLEQVEIQKKLEHYDEFVPKKGDRCPELEEFIDGFDEVICVKQ